MLWQAVHIQYQHFGPIPGDGGTKVLVAASEMNGLKMLGKTVRQDLSGSGVILIQDYTDWFHGSPNSSPRDAVALAATEVSTTGVERLRARTALLLAQRFLGRGLERFSLEFSVLF